jgi:hypothetical protein
MSEDYFEGYKSKPVAEKEVAEKLFVDQIDRGLTQSEMAKQFNDLLAELSPFQRDFVRHYCETGNGAEAARRAGSKSKEPKKVASKLVRDERIQKAIAYAQLGRIRSSAITEADVINRIDDLYLVAYSEKQYKVALEAASKMGEALGMFKAKNTNNSAKVNTAIYEETKSLREAQRDIEQDKIVQENRSLEPRKGKEDEDEIMDFFSRIKADN